MPDALKTLKAMADGTRLRIIRLLGAGPLCVCELAEILGLEQSRLSHQLRILKDAALVEDVRESRWIIYRIPKSRRETVASLVRMAFRNDPSGVETRRSDLADLGRCRRKNLRRKTLRLAKTKRALISGLPRKDQTPGGTSSRNVQGKKPKERK